VTSITRLDRLLVVLSIAAVVWGALAFGAVYPWAYTPLAIACAAVGLLAVLIHWRGRPEIWLLAMGLAAIAVAIAIQLAPLPERMVGRISPNAEFFSFQGSAAALPPAVSASRDSVGRHVRALSLAPSRTWLSLGLFVSLALFFSGTVRLTSAVGAPAVVRPLVWFGFVLALIGIVQYVLTGGETYLMKIYGFWQPQNRASPFGPFVNRNHFAGWMIMVLPLAFGSAYGAWEAGSSRGAESFRDRVSWASSPEAGRMMLMVFAAAVMGLAVVLSQSRSGMAGLVAGTTMFGFAVVRTQSTARAKAAAIAACAVVLVGVGLWAGADRIVQRAASVRGDASVGGRRQVWADAIRLASDFPLAGTGLNTFGIAMIVYQTDREVYFQEAHNEYLQLAAEGGLLVGIPIVLTIAVFARDVRRRFREAPRTGTTYWLRVGAVVGLLSIALQSLVEFSLQMPGNAALFAALAAIAVHQAPNLRFASTHAAR
jgi:hypothetical protein